MKKLVLCLLLMGFMAQGHSQIQLKEAKVVYTPESMKLDPATNRLTLDLSEAVVNDFSQDPLDYVRRNFDIASIVAQNKDAGFSFYEVNFKSKKGHLLARFDKDGELTSTFQKFKDVDLPDEVKLEVLRSFKDGEIVGNHYSARSKGWQLKNENYVVKVRNGEKLRRIKVKKHSDRYVVAKL